MLSERLDGTHIPHAGSAMVVYEIVCQNTWDRFFRFGKLSTSMDSRPEPPGLFSERLTHRKPGAGYFETKGMCEKFLELLFDRI